MHKTLYFDANLLQYISHTVVFSQARLLRESLWQSCDYVDSFSVHVTADNKWKYWIKVHYPKPGLCFIGSYQEYH